MDCCRDYQTVCRPDSLSFDIVQARKYLTIIGSRSDILNEAPQSVMREQRHDFDELTMAEEELFDFV